MATYTQYYNLDKYEGTDRPNLRDQYNAAMDKVDSALHSQAGTIGTQGTVIATVQQTQTQQGAQIATLQSDVTTAQSTATSAASAASQASSDVSALSQSFDAFKTQPFVEDFRSQSGTTGGKNWSAEVRTFQFGDQEHPMQIVEIRGRTLGVTTTLGPASLYYGNDPTIPSITYPQSFLVAPAVVEQASGSSWVIKEGTGTNTQSGGANIVRPSGFSSATDVYWSIIAIGRATAPLS